MRGDDPVQDTDVDTQLIGHSRVNPYWHAGAIFLGVLIGLSPFEPARSQAPPKEAIGGAAMPLAPRSAPNAGTDQSRDVFQNASQAQLRACAFQWREMKRSGKAGGKIWREFARSCLAGH